MGANLASHSRRNRLLRALPPADFALLAPDLKGILLEQSAILFEPGDAVEYVHFPHTAIISLLAVMRDGQTVETAAVGRSGVVGGMSGFGPWRAFARATVQVPGTASRIASRRFRAAIKQSESLRTLVLRNGQSIVAQIQQSACNALLTLRSDLSLAAADTGSNRQRAADARISIACAGSPQDDREPGCMQASGCGLYPISPAGSDRNC
jgi:hypothetical protein